MMRPHGPWENGYYPVEKLTWFSDIQDLGEFHRGPVFGSDCTWTLTKHHSSELCCPYLQRVELEEEDYASKLQGKKTMAIPWEPNIIQGLSRYPAVYTWRNLTALWRWLVGEHWRWLIGEHWRWLIAVHWRWLIGEPWKWLFGEHWRCPSGNLEDDQKKKNAKSGGWFMHLIRWVVNTCLLQWPSLSGLSLLALVTFTY